MLESASPDPRTVARADYGDPDPQWRRIDWRAHRRRVELDGSTVEYVEVGEGEPVLFVHGISGCWQNWLENLPHVGAGRRAIGLDLPGFGASPMPEWEVDMAAYGRCVRDFCAALDLDRVTLVGNSMGGLIALEAALGDPRRFARLVLVDAAGSLTIWGPDARVTLMGLAWKRIGPRLAARGDGILRRPRGRRLTWAPLVRYPNRLRTDLLLEQMVGGMRCPAFGDALPAVLTRDVRAQLGAVELPSLIVWGLADRLIPVDAAFDFHRRIPDSRLEIFEDTGHMPQLERPHRFNALLDDFLAG